MADDTTTSVPEYNQDELLIAMIHRNREQRSELEDEMSLLDKIDQFLTRLLNRLG